MDQPTSEEALKKLGPLIGEWVLEAKWPDGEPWPGGPSRPGSTEGAVDEGSLGGQSGGPLEQHVGFGESGRGAQASEDVAGLSKRFGRFGRAAQRH
jgi:hypothetical protein